jgi:hypothetical protein
VRWLFGCVRECIWDTCKSVEYNCNKLAIPKLTNSPSVCTHRTGGALIAAVVVCRQNNFVDRFGHVVSICDLIFSTKLFLVCSSFSTFQFGAISCGCVTR